MENKKIGIAIIGAGAIAGIHIDAYKSYSEQCEVRAVCDIFVEKAQQLIVQYGLENAIAVKDYHDILSDERIDAVSICLPPSLHAPTAVDCLNGGKHVICEKPMAMNAKEAQEMIDVSNETGKLLQSGPHAGCLQLRHAIARQLWDFRGMAVDPENIVIGAGMDFLCNLLIQLLGRERIYAVEDPGYDKIRRIYDAAGVKRIMVPMDGDGVLPEALDQAGVLHISPSHHFPTGITTSKKRRDALLCWAQQNDGYIIEDDYDSEFRFRCHPMPALQTMDRQGRVIYMNSFSKTLAPSIRVSYMVLPAGLMEKFRQNLGFYSCTVSGFEQYTLARFLSGGHFEKHINRMRKFYKSRRDRVLTALEKCPCAHRFTVMEENAGLHFLLKVDTDLPEDVLTERFLAAGIRVRTLDSYYEGTPPPDRERVLVVNYSGLEEALLNKLENLTL
jgi:GntR family transcriptional regulator/MocR family aminotransferase